MSAALRLCGLVLAAGAMLFCAVSTASADCTTAGTTVTCSATGGTQTAPVGTGAEDGYTVNVLSGATLDVSATPGGTAINLHDSSNVTNAGSIVAGDNGTGVYVNNGNTVSNSGSIAVGDNGTAISVCCDNTVTNTGTLTAGTGGFGIYGADRTSATNSGTITVGAGGYGIIFYGNGAGTATVTNNGTINALGGFGIGAFSNYNVVNNGTLNVGVNGTGIQVDGGNTVTNAGTINVSGTFGGIGVSLNAYGDTTANLFTNSGSILATGPIYSITGDSNNTIVNTGVIQGTVFLYGFSNTLTNRGYMIGADLAYTGIGGGQIGGTLTNDPAGTIAIRVTPTQNDRYLADTVVLNGGRLHMVVKAGLYGTTTVYSSATTGASPVASCGCTPITGTFDSVTTSSPFFTAAADYSTTGEVNVTLTRLGMGSIPGMTPNQRAVSDVLEPGYSTGLTGALATFYANLMAATSLGVLDQLSGAGTAAAQDGAFASGSLFSGAMFQQVLAWLNGAPGGGTSGGLLGYAEAPKTKLAGKPGYEAFAAMPRDAQAAQGRWRAWTSGFGGTRSIDGQAGTANQTSRNFGGVFGVERQLTPDVLVGLAVGGSGANFSASGLSTSGRTNAGHVGAYAIQRMGAAYLAATLNYARGETTTERTIAGVGTTETAKGRYASDQLSSRIEIGRSYAFGRATVTPFAAIEPAVLWQNAYSETSTTSTGAPGTLGLSYQANTVTSLPLFLGAQLNAHYALASGQTFAPFARLSWVHEFKPERSIEASFISIPGAAFTADGARAAADALRLDTGGTLSIGRSASLFVNLTGEFSNRSRGYAALGGARMSW